MFWYHDHALGITRLNVYAGLFGGFFVRDDFEDGLNLPKGQYEIPLLIYDRSFDADGQLFTHVSTIAISLGARSLWRRGFGQRQIISLSASRASAVSLPRAERGEWAFFSPGFFEWATVSPDRN